MRAPVVVLGSLNMDLVVFAETLPESGETLIGREFREMPGGKGLNQAVAAARAGAQTVMVGAVGDDTYGRQLRGVLGDERIDGSRVRSVPGVRTGVASIGVDAGGANRIVVVPGANALVTADQVPDGPAGVLLASLEVPLHVVAQAFARASESGMTTILNPAPATPLPEGLLADCDVLVPNEHEAAALTGESTADLPGAERAAMALCARGPRTVVVTLGARGALVVHGGQARHVPAVRVEPVDTTAAGDAFCGVLAARVAAGDSLGHAVDTASAAGALATTVVGAVASLPQWAAILTALRPAADASDSP